MKKTIILFALSLIYLSSYAGNGGFEKAIGKNLAALGEASNDLDKWQAVANNFVRIGDTEKEQWLPQYYAAYCYTIMTTMTPDNAQKDAYLDLAQERMKLMESIERDTSEANALQGFIYMMRIPIDPMTRGQQFSGQSMAALQQAIRQNENNPRALYLLAQMKYGTAQFFGSGVEEACKDAKKALDTFGTFEPASKIAPSWGLAQTEALAAQCKN